LVYYERETGLAGAMHIMRKHGRYKGDVRSTT
jgi:hypothetical protein